MQKIGILCAGDEEFEPFLPHIHHPVISEKAMLKFHEGYIDEIPVAALFCGVCKVNAAIATQILIDTFHADIIINAGTAGGMDEQIKLFDTVISTQTAYHDVSADILTEFHPWMPSVYFDADAHLLQVAKTVFGQKNNVCFGRMVTGESFIEDRARDTINKTFAPLSVDMETAGIAHVCHVNNIPFIAIRAITDTADHMGITNFEKNCKKASEISCEMVMTFLKGLDCNIR